MSATLAPSPPQAAPPPRMRADLVIVRQGTFDHAVWVVKDPVTLHYFHLTAEEYAILRMLDGQTSRQEIRRRFERQFAPRELSAHGLEAFIAQLHGQGLLVTQTPGQGEQLLQRQRKRRTWERATWGLQLLAIRFRGIDPTTLLTWLAPVGKLLFSRAMGILVGLLVLGALILFGTQFETARHQMPTLAAFLSAQNAWLMILAVISLKVLHELGHGLACRRFGGECHELGVMLLVGIPCLYCNVSSAWLLPQRRQRIIISAAGMYVELLIAALATFLWWQSEPGLFRAYCWNLMVAASVGTMLVNGNPLLRYDGYYILSDLTGVPNLWRQSQEVLRQRWARWCLGVELYADRWLPPRNQNWLFLYALAALGYRVFVLTSILWLVYLVLAEHRLQSLAHVFIVLCVAGLSMGPLLAAARFLKDPVRRYQFMRIRPVVTSTLLLGGLSSLALIPLPYRVPAVAVIEPADAQHLYVTSPGQLIEVLPEGTKVAAGERIARLANPELKLEVAQLRSDVTRQRLLIENLQSRRETEQLPSAQATLADFEQRLASRESDLAELELRAPVAGEVLPPPAIPRQPFAPGELEAWQGTPLEARNVGAFLKTGTPLCLIGRADHVEAVLSISEDDVELVTVGQPVRLWLDESPGELLYGEITELARLDLELAPRDPSAAQRIATRKDPSGADRPVETLYQARVKLDPTEKPLLLRSGGEAKITVATHSLVWRAWRFLQRTFRFSTLTQE